MYIGTNHGRAKQACSEQRGEKMLQRDLPTFACCSPRGGRPSLGRASPPLSSHLPFISSCAAPVVSLLSSCYKGSTLIKTEIIAKRHLAG